NQANLQAQQTFYQQQRADNAYSQSLDYTTRQGTTPSRPVSRPLQQEQSVSPVPPTLPESSVSPVVSKTSESLSAKQDLVENEKIFCPGCGASLSKGTKVCPECGEQV
ncbi:MAG: zinc ribbon domain-containing protein, partial [Candidatus Paraprevotella stercoravium]|nr:zinc ribbon domain-containing protein [Candidatus Paraprevotella stercoravium]